MLDTYNAEVKIAGQAVILEIYDTAGQEDFQQIRTMTYPNTSVFIMCYSCVYMPSLINVKNFWEPETRKDVKDAPIILCGNKQDLSKTNPREYVAPIQAKNVGDKINVAASLQCSAYLQANGENGNVPTVFKTAIKAAFHYENDPSIVEPDGDSCCKKCCKTLCCCCCCAVL